jgi:hypothetical protein
VHGLGLVGGCIGGLLEPGGDDLAFRTQLLAEFIQRGMLDLAFEEGVDQVGDETNRGFSLLDDGNFNFFFCALLLIDIEGQ